MARAYFSISATNIADLVAEFDDTTVSMLDRRFISLSVIATDVPRRNGVEYQLIATHDSGGTTLTDPITLQVFEGKTLDAARAALESYVTANPGTWVGPAYEVAYPFARRTAGFAVVAPACVDPAAENNWGKSVSATTPIYTVASVPSAAASLGAIVYVSDALRPGGGVGLPAFSDGTNWRCICDNTIITA